MRMDQSEASDKFVPDFLTITVSQRIQELTGQINNLILSIGEQVDEHFMDVVKRKDDLLHELDALLLRDPNELCFPQS